MPAMYVLYTFETHIFINGPYHNISIESSRPRCLVAHGTAPLDRAPASSSGAVMIRPREQAGRRRLVGFGDFTEETEVAKQ